jgi:hypothetical protein
LIVGKPAEHAGRFEAPQASNDFLRLSGPLLVIFLILEEGQSLYLLCDITHVGQFWSRILHFIPRQPRTVSRISLCLSACSGP